jgi:hypothetical protein
MIWQGSSAVGTAVGPLAAGAADAADADGASLDDALGAALGAAEIAAEGAGADADAGASDAVDAVAACVAVDVVVQAARPMAETRTSDQGQRREKGLAVGDMTYLLMGSG